METPLLIPTLDGNYVNAYYITSMFVRQIDPNVHKEHPDYEPRYFLVMCNHESGIQGGVASFRRCNTDGQAHMFLDRLVKQIRKGEVTKGALMAFDWLVDTKPTGEDENGKRFAAFCDLDRDGLLSAIPYFGESPLMLWYACVEEEGDDIATCDEFDTREAAQEWAERIYREHLDKD